jgi:endonuclease G
MMVWKSGRSTGFTEGFVDGVKMVVPLSYRHVGLKILEEVFRIVPRPGARNEEISIGGDSGSVWVDEQSGKAVGLHFAGEVADLPEHALAHDIGLVIESLRIRLPAQEPPVVEPIDQDKPAGEVPVKRSWWKTLTLLFKSIFKGK